MEAYGGLARVYDVFMDDVPYGQWCGRILELLWGSGIKDGLVLDLGCGTGRLTRLLRDAGYDMIGVDLSEEMLSIAREAEDGAADAKGGTTSVMTDAATDVTTDAATKGAAHLGGGAGEGGGSNFMGAGEILYLQQDMREFELYGTVRAIVSACDCINYILEEDELREVFRLANNYLDPGGLFLFDMNTEYKYRELMGDRTFFESRDEGSYVWENEYDPESGINEYDLTLFIRERGGLFSRAEETHYQRGYALGTIEHLLEEAGMEFVAAYDGYSDGPAREDSERVLVMARERGKGR